MFGDLNYIWTKLCYGQAFFYVSVYTGFEIIKG